MRRREFTAGVGGAMAAWPLALRAQPAKKLPVVGVIFADARLADMAGPDPKMPVARALVHGLRELGWIEGRTVVIERRSADGQPERAPAIVAELIARGVDVLVVGAATWLQRAARAATRDIPIVAFFNGDPVAEGLVASLARPGGNLTGVTFLTGHELQAKRLQLLKELAPGIARVGLLGRRQDLEAHRSGVASLDMTGIFVEVDRADQFDDALATILRERADAVHVLGSTTLYVRAARIAAFAAEHRLPTIFGNREAVEAGGLMSYGASVPGLFRQMAGYVDRILKGAKPAGLAVQQPVKFEMVLNMKTARALGLTIAPLLLAQADEVIE